MTGSMGTFPIFLRDDPWLWLATLASEHKTVVGHGQFNIQLKKTRVSKDKVEDMHSVLYLLRSNMNNGRLFWTFF